MNITMLQTVMVHTGKPDPQTHKLLRMGQSYSIGKEISQAQADSLVAMRQAVISEGIEAHKVTKVIEPEIRGDRKKPK